MHTMLRLSVRSSQVLGRASSMCARGASVCMIASVVFIAEILETAYKSVLATDCPNLEGVVLYPSWRESRT